MILLVRDREGLEQRIRRFYEKDPLVPLVPRSVAKTGRLMRRGELSAVGVELRDFSIRPLALEKTEEGYLADWESWVGYSELSWEEMQEKRPQEPKLFRVLCSTVNYYNYEFKDDSEWRAYRLRSPDGEDFLYGYALRYSIQESMMSSAKGARDKGAAFILRIHYPENAPSGNQVLIAEVVEPGWILHEVKSKASQK
jgi:hypothetical protein